MIEVRFPFTRIVSVANLREHWTKRSARAKVQRYNAYLQMREAALMVGTTGPLKITMIRIAPRPMDTDNLAGGFKAIRDGVADWLRRDDGDPLITWLYEQQKGQPKEHAVIVRVEG